MSDKIQTIFNEYTRLRLNGLDATEAIRALHIHIKGLDRTLRNELAGILRAWEGQRTEKISVEDRKKLANLRQQGNKTVSCPACGKTNPAKEQICYSCGTLITKQNNNATNVLKPTTEEFHAIDDAHFGENGILLLASDTNIEPFVLRPQMKSTGITFGRNKAGEEDVDVDLEPANASIYGVSRLHAAITYDSISETLSLFDMSSTNGSFINGQRLQMKERRAIRHGDEIRFGKLAFRVIYTSDDM